MKKYLHIQCIVVVLLFVVALQKVSGQSEKLFTVDKDLPSSMVTAMCQDSYGNMWIGTEDGLCVYDGAKTKVYKCDNQSNKNILGNVITTLCSPSSGSLYIGFRNGMQVFDLQEESFTNVEFRNASGKKTNVYVQTIIERKNGDILIGTLGRGVFILGKKSTTAKQFPPFELSDLFIGSMFEDLNGVLWLGVERKGILRIQYNGKKYSSFYVPGTQKFKVSSFCADSKNNIYIGTTEGVYIYRNGIDELATVIEGTERCVVKCLLINKKNDLLVGTDGDGVKTFDLMSGRIVERELDVAIINQAKSKIRCLLEDRSGNLWLGIFQKGVLLKPSENNHFGYIGHNSFARNLIGDACVTAILKDCDGNLWVAADNDGLFCLDKNGRRVSHFSKERGCNIPNSITCLFEDSKKQLWAGTIFKGLVRINKTNGSCIYSSAFRNVSVLGIVEDREGKMWVGTMGNGLYQIDQNANLLYHLPMTNGKHYSIYGNYLNNSWINGLCLGHDQKLYINTCYGLGCYDLDKKSFVNTFKKNCILLGVAVNASFEDASHNIWAGTTEGLYCWNPSLQKLNKYDVSNGLPSNIIQGIREDNQGNLWIITNYGISKFDSKRRGFVNYYANDGLQGNEFSLNAIVKDAQGIIYAAGVNGITYFNPVSISKNAKALNVRITDVYLHDQAIKANSQSGGRKILDATSEGIVRYRLSAKDNSFCIEFATDELCNTESINYLYSLNGKDWIALQRGINKVYFSNMNPGTYTFKVKAQNYDVQSPVEEIIIAVSPFWYASWPAIFLYAALILMLAYFIVSQAKKRKRSRLIMLEQARKEEINDAKMQFFIDISHEIRTPMTMIINPIKRLLSIDKDAECRRLYGIISRNADRILLLVNQLLDIRKIDKGLMKLKFQETDVVALVKTIAGTFEERFATKHIDFALNPEMPSLNVYIDPNYFDKVIANLLSNAVKYTSEGGKIEIQIRKDDVAQYYEIEVMDNGIGVSDDQLNLIFERFYQVDNNLNEANVGTGVGLHLTRSLVELHHGKIWAEKGKEEQGVRFIIRLPLGNDFLGFNEICSLDGEAKTKIELAENSDMIVGQTTKPKRKYFILIAEDDKEIGNYLFDELGKDFHVEVYRDGKEALDKMQDVVPDLVVSDILMPRMDGMSLCKKIKLNIRLNHIPVILLTAKVCDEDKQEGLSIGADCYITKPFNIELLKSTILNILYNREKLRNIYQGQQEQDDKVKNINIKTPDDKLMERVMKSINKNIANPEFTVEALADDVSLSRVHLHRKLKELTNQTTRDFIRNVRLNQAAKLLKRKGVSISEVANAVGFNSITHFSYAFKALYGVSPSEYWEKYGD